MIDVFALGGFVVGFWLGRAAYGWCAQASKRRKWYRLTIRRNASGEMEARRLRGWLLPRGSVPPHATFAAPCWTA